MWSAKFPFPNVKTARQGIVSVCIPVYNFIFLHLIKLEISKSLGNRSEYKIPPYSDHEEKGCFTNRLFFQLYFEMESHGDTETPIQKILHLCDTYKVC